MKKFIQSLTILAFFMAIVPKADASILLEPVVGYNLSSSFKSEGGDEVKGNGLAYGGRVGWQNLGFQLGLDYLNSSIELDDSAYKNPLSLSEWGLFAGFEFPVMLRAYAGYIFSATGETKVGSSKIELTEGTGMKLGVGLTMLPFLDINLEYRKGTFGHIKQGTLGADIDTDYSAYMLGFSLPFNL